MKFTIQWSIILWLILLLSNLRQHQQGKHCPHHQRQKVFLSTDHGRGNGPDWKHHGKKIEGAEYSGAADLPLRLHGNPLARPVGVCWSVEALPSMNDSTLFYLRLRHSLSIPDLLR